jgi:hypothetical protein
MPALPSNPDLDQLRRQAKERLRRARSGDADAIAWVAQVSPNLDLASAQLRLARDHGFPSWPRMVAEIERRRALDERDVDSLAKLVAENRAAATRQMSSWLDHPLGASPLSYLAMQRYDTSTGRWRTVTGTADAARVLIDAGAPVDGERGRPETPLITAASYGDVDIARVLIDHGADLEAVAAADAGGVPGGTALLHAAVFGSTAVVDLLVAAGARIGSIEEAAACGDLGSWLETATPEARLRALVMAADHQRLDVIGRLVAAGTPVDETDPTFGRHPLRTAAANGRPHAVNKLLELGADPGLRDTEGNTALDLCRRNRTRAEDAIGYDQVEVILVAATMSGP